jgi:chromosome segregation ATPase
MTLKPPHSNSRFASSSALIIGAVASFFISTSPIVDTLVGKKAQEDDIKSYQAQLAGVNKVMESVISRQISMESELNSYSLQLRAAHADINRLKNQLVYEREKREDLIKEIERKEVRIRELEAHILRLSKGDGSASSYILTDKKAK